MPNRIREAFHLGSRGSWEQGLRRLIDHCRQEFGLYLEEIARGVGYKAENLSRFLDGTQGMTVDKICKLCLVLQAFARSDGRSIHLEPFFPTPSQMIRMGYRSALLFDRLKLGDVNADANLGYEDLLFLHLMLRDRSYDKLSPGSSAFTDRLRAGLSSIRHDAEVISGFTPNFGDPKQLVQLAIDHHTFRAHVRARQADHLQLSDGEVLVLHFALKVHVFAYHQLVISISPPDERTVAAYLLAPIRAGWIHTSYGPFPPCLRDARALLNFLERWKKPWFVLMNNLFPDTKDPNDSNPLTRYWNPL